MLYLNQLEYPHLKYDHNMAHGGPPEGRNSVKTSGCGLCCACMVVDHLTDKSLPIEDCVRLSEENGANLNLGTSMDVLGKIIADMYDLEFSYTNDIDCAIACLQKGGRVAALVSGDREDHKGLFSRRAHYILLLSYDGEEFSILDPSFTDKKYTEEGRVGRVRVDKPFVYTSKKEIVLATETKDPKYYLFSRKRL